ncbi:IS4 family transposase [candidate division TA06 bacterium]|uniref:IS4 family transposase n=1 Tax=candidate division TA06 bacterium TaxID=2250710 RepID=A0A933I8L5_UNCT6|nr:IS4 family transposase [candidate division TA06 bacterium]
MDLQELVYAFDSTTIDLCASLFPWAHFKKTKSAVKLHTLLDLHGNIPVFISITKGNVHDVTVLDGLPVEPGAYYMIDRGYLDFSRLYKIHRSQAFFVIPAKSNTRLRRLYSSPVDKKSGILSDQVVVCANYQASQDYPEKLRRIRYYDEEQNLGIKGFYGTSDNAVRSQIWIAVSIYVLVAIVKKRLNLRASLYSILQVLSISLFEKEPILQAFSEIDSQSQDLHFSNQLVLFD